MAPPVPLPALRVATAAVTPQESRWLEISRPWLEAYARRLGADFRVVEAAHLKGGKSPFADLLDGRDRLLFIPPDTLVRPDAPDLFRLVPEDCLGTSRRPFHPHDRADVLVASTQHRAWLDSSAGAEPKLFPLDTLWHWGPESLYVPSEPHFIRFGPEGYAEPDHAPDPLDQTERSVRQMKFFAGQMARDPRAPWFFMHHFRENDPFWQAIAARIEKTWGPGARLLAPNVFHERFARTFPYDLQDRVDRTQLDAVVVHKGMFDLLGQETFRWIMDRLHPCDGNEVFAIFSVAPCKPPRNTVWFEPVWGEWRRRQEQPPPAVTWAPDEGTTAILVTTYNRPGSLDRTLASLAALQAQILVVNDGSDPQFREAYADVYRRHGVRTLDLPDNRGLPAALNIGVSYWLANDRVEWISYFQDDVEVHPDLFRILAAYQHPERQPILTGAFDPLHKVDSVRRDDGRTVLTQRACSATHLHAHRRYWEESMPIPTPYFGAPKRDRGRPGQAGDEDWWLTCWSPCSITKRGGAVLTIPFLVRTLPAAEVPSTWGNSNQAAAPPLSG